MMVARISHILKIALPIAIGLSSSFIMSLVDIAMVSSLGNAAVSAVGISIFCNTLITAFVTGVAPAIQGMTARRLGENSVEKKCVPLNSGLLIVLLIGVPLSCFCIVLAPQIISTISSDAEVQKEGISYLGILLTAVVASGMNAVFRGFWAGIGNSKIFMLTTLFSNLVNVFLNYVLIFGKFGLPVLGTLGAGIASVVSMYLATLIYVGIATVYYRDEGFLRAICEVPFLLKIGKMGVPVTLQQVFFSAGSIVLFWMYGRLGTSELAAATVLVRVTMVMLLFSMALGQTSATLVSRTLGEGDPSEACRWGWDIAKLGVVWTTLLGLPLLVFPTEFLSVFLSDPQAISLAKGPLLLTAVTTGVIGLSFIFASTLYSVGDGKRVMLISFVLRWLVLIPLVWLIGPHLKYGLFEIWVVQMIYGLTLVLAVVFIWNSGRGKTINI